MKEIEANFKLLKDCGDATSWYDVEIPDGTTVRDFLQWVFYTRRQKLSRVEFGSIYIKKTGSGVLDFYDCLASAEYKGTNIESESISAFFGERISRIFANGGWGLMTYFIFINDEGERNETD